LGNAHLHQYYNNALCLLLYLGDLTWLQNYKNYLCWNIWAMHTLLQNYNISLCLFQLFGYVLLTAMLQQFSLSVETHMQSIFACNTTSIIFVRCNSLATYTWLQYYIQFSLSDVTLGQRPLFYKTRTIIFVCCNSWATSNFLQN
jgi:hypothetical protein